MNADLERATYRGFRLLVTATTIQVSTRDGRPVGICQSMSSVRRLVRGYRRESRLS